MDDKPYSRSIDVPSLDTVFTLLSDPYRRGIVAILSEREAEITLHDLATAIASVETETELEAVSTGTINDLRAMLHHVHLPKLDDANIVDYDTETKTVRPLQTEALVQSMNPFEEGQEVHQFIDRATP